MTTGRCREPPQGVHVVTTARCHNHREVSCVHGQSECRITAILQGAVDVNAGHAQQELDYRNLPVARGGLQSRTMCEASSAWSPVHVDTAKAAQEETKETDASKLGRLREQLLLLPEVGLQKRQKNRSGQILY